MAGLVWLCSTWLLVGVIVAGAVAIQVLCRKLAQAHVRHETLIRQAERHAAEARHWKQECIGSQAAADECEISVSDMVGDAIAAADRGIDPAGIDERNVAVLRANRENLTDEERAALDDAFAAVVDGPIPYVLGADDDTEEL